jgi:hypothetical protein
MAFLPHAREVAPGWSVGLHRARPSCSPARGCAGSVCSTSTPGWSTWGRRWRMPRASPAPTSPTPVVTPWTEGRSRHTSSSCPKGSRAGWRASAGTVPTAATCSSWPSTVSCPGWRAPRAGTGVARWRRGGVPVRDADEPHLDPHRSGAGAARRAGQRVLRPGDRAAGRAERRGDVAQVRGMAAAGRSQDLRDGERRVPQRGSPRTASVDEAVDRGADYGTMALLRAAGGFDAATSAAEGMMPPPERSPFPGRPGHLADPYFRWAVQVDDMGLQQVLQLWDSATTRPR